MKLLFSRKIYFDILLNPEENIKLLTNCEMAC